MIRFASFLAFVYCMIAKDGINCLEIDEDERVSREGTPRAQKAATK